MRAGDVGAFVVGVCEGAVVFVAVVGGAVAGGAAVGGAEAVAGLSLAPDIPVKKLQGAMTFANVSADEQPLARAREPR